MTDEGPPDIELVIDELVLHGMPSTGRRALERELRRELGRLFTAEPPTAAAAGRGVERGADDLRRPITLSVRANASAGEIGHRLAHVIHGASRRP